MEITLTDYQIEKVLEWAKESPKYRDEFKKQLNFPFGESLDKHLLLHDDDTQIFIAGVIV